MQTLGFKESPEVHVQPVSTVHVESQPSPGRIPPSSQYPVAGDKTIPSPHVSPHTLAVKLSPNVQTQPASTEHEMFHPSPVIKFPSSQYPDVGAIDFPSPQISDQELAVEESPRVQVQPASTEQLLSHPSELFVFPSSQ